MPLCECDTTAGVCVGASIDGQKDVLLSARKQKQVVPAHRNEEEDDIAAESESEEFDDEFDGSGGGDSSSSAGASDLEGMPVASASHDDAGPSETKRSKQGTAQSITEEGASSKIGIVFSRILEKRAKQGVLAVRTPPPCPLSTSIALSIAVQCC